MSILALSGGDSRKVDLRGVQDREFGKLLWGPVLEEHEDLGSPELLDALADRGDAGSQLQLAVYQVTRVP